MRFLHLLLPIVCAVLPAQLRATIDAIRAPGHLIVSGHGVAGTAFGELRRSRTTGGAGLGPAIVRRRCGQHGIALTADESAARGTRFTLGFRS